MGLDGAIAQLSYNQVERIKAIAARKGTDPTKLVDEILDEVEKSLGGKV
jgi:hypothetical protein